MYVIHMYVCMNVNCVEDLLRYSLHVLYYLPRRARHPNIVQMYEQYTEDKKVYLILQL